MSSQGDPAAVTEGIPSPGMSAVEVSAPGLTLTEAMLGLMRLGKVTRNDRDLDSFLTQLVAYARLLLGATGTAVALGDKQLCSWRAKCGEPGPPIGGQLCAGQGISGGCLATGEVQLCENTSTDVRVDAELCRRLGIGSMIVVPITGNGQVEGIFEAWWSHPLALESSHAETLQKLADFTGRVAGTVRASPERSMGGPLAVSAETLVSSARVWFRKARALTASRLSKLDALRPAAREIALWMKFRTRGILLAFLLASIPWAVWHSVGARSRSAPGSLSSHERSQKDIWMRAAPAESSITVPLGFSPWPGRMLQTPGTFFRPVAVPAFPNENAIAEPEPLSAAAGLLREARVLENDIVPFPFPALGSFRDRGWNVTVPNNSLTLNPFPPHSIDGIPPGLIGGELLLKVPPLYPRSARSAGIEGTVVLEVLIDEEGHVQDITVKKGPPLLARAAIDAVKQWRYQPCLLDDSPVRVTTEISISFRLR
jgi:TonB family protein